jgi:RimJ/RimL family protein N-acetyltransferase
MIGFLGLIPPSFEAHFTPAIEIGWRLGSMHWNKGYATEAALAVLDYGFKQLKLNEIVSFTVPLKSSIETSHGEDRPESQSKG